MGGSKSGQVRCAQMPDKSGIDVALCPTLLSGPTPGAITCPHAGIATAVTIATNGRKFRCAFMPTSVCPAGVLQNSKGHALLRPQLMDLICNARQPLALTLPVKKGLRHVPVAARHSGYLNCTA